MSKDRPRNLNAFQIRNIGFLKKLYKHDAVTDDIVETLRQIELDYFSLLEKNRQLEKKLDIDEKTNVLKFKNDYLTNIIKTASRIHYGTDLNNYPVTLARFDIDDFSSFNTMYGHDVGDQVLVKFCGILKKNSRPTDYIIRFGGEEFDVILPSTNIKGAVSFMNKIYEKLEGFSVTQKDSEIPVTVSAGLSHFLYTFEDSRIVNDTTIEERYHKMQQEADDALYESKYRGKNMYCIYDPDKNDEYIRIRQEYSKLQSMSSKNSFYSENSTILQ